MRTDEIGPTTRWWWIRHAPVPRLADRMYGSTDPAADVSAARVFAALAAHLPADAVWVVSHLQRTRQTAEAIGEAGYRLPELTVERALGEQNLGDLHGVLHVDHSAARTDPYRGFWPVHPEEPTPGGESWLDVRRRTADVVGRLDEQHEGRDLVCVSHGGPIRAALAHALDLEPRIVFSFTLPHLSLTRIARIHDPRPGGPAYRVGCVGQVF